MPETYKAVFVRFLNFNGKFVKTRLVSKYLPARFFRAAFLDFLFLQIFEDRFEAPINSNPAQGVGCKHDFKFDDRGKRDIDVHHEGYQSCIHYVVLRIQDQPENSIVL
jgi:hypothetical protein